MPEAIAGFHRRIEAARSRLDGEKGALLVSSPVDPLTVEQISALYYAERIRMDDELRDLAPTYARIGIDDGYVADVKEIFAGRAGNDLINRIFGREIETHRRSGAYSCSKGGADWRRLARHLAHAEIEVLKRMFERDEGQSVIEHTQWAFDHLPKPLSEQTAKKSADDESRKIPSSGGPSLGSTAGEVDSSVRRASEGFVLLMWSPGKSWQCRNRLLWICRHV